MSLKKKLWLIAALIFVACPPSASPAAESQAEPEDATKMNIEALMNVTVQSASKFEQPLTELESSFSIVTAQDIKKYGYRTLAEILQSQRSFLVSNDRNYTYVGMRGFGRTGDYSTRILLLIDGHRMNDNLFDSAYYGYEFPLDVDLIDRVEIIRGPGSSLYGSNAFYGTINVITRKGRDLKGFELSGAGGTFDTYDGRFSYGNLYDNGLEVLFSGSLHDSEGDRSLYYREFDQRRNPEEPRATDNGIARNLDYERSSSLFAHLSFRDLSLEAAYVDRKKGVPTAEYGTAFNRRMYTSDDRWFIELKYEHTYSLAGVMARAYYDRYDYSSPLPYNVADPGDPEVIVVNRDSSRNDWWGAELQFTKTLFSNHRIIAGGEYVQNTVQSFENHDIDPYYQYLDINKTTSRYGLYLQDDFKVRSDLYLHVGLRYDDYSSFGDNISPRATLIYTPFKGTTAKLIYGEAFRAPNHFELYFDSPYFQKSNESLNPEKISTYEAVLEQMLGERIKLTIDGFYMESRDHIVKEMDTDGELVFKNREGQKSTGVEFELEGKWQNGLQGRASYSYQDARDRDTDRWLENSPRHVANVSLTGPLYLDKVFAGVELRYMSERQSQFKRVGDVALTNLTLFSQKLLPGLELSASVYNLFDRTWREPVGDDYLQNSIRQDGRTYRVKLTYLY